MLCTLTSLGKEEDEPLRVKAVTVKPSALRRASTIGLPALPEAYSIISALETYLINGSGSAMSERVANPQGCSRGGQTYSNDDDILERHDEQANGSDKAKEKLRESR